MRLGGGPQQFGVDAERVPALLAELATEDLEFMGFHVFAGSQNLNHELLCEAQRQTVALVARLADEAPMVTRYINIGGGFGIPYFEKDDPLDIVAVGQNLESLLEAEIGRACPMREWSSSSGGTSSARPASTSRVSWTGRNRGAARFSWWTAGCITSWPHPGTSAR